MEEKELQNQPNNSMREKTNKPLTNIAIEFANAPTRLIASPKNGTDTAASIITALRSARAAFCLN